MPSQPDTDGRVTLANVLSRVSDMPANTFALCIAHDVTRNGTSKVMAADEDTANVDLAAADAKKSSFVTHTTTYEAEHRAYTIVNAACDLLVSQLKLLPWFVKHKVLLDLMETAPSDDTTIVWQPDPSRPTKMILVVRGKEIKRCTAANVEVYKAYQRIHHRSDALLARVAPVVFAEDDSDASALHTHFEKVYSPSALNAEGAALKAAFDTLVRKAATTLIPKT